jgi:hypothetical protein
MKSFLRAFHSARSVDISPVKETIRNDFVQVGHHIVLNGRGVVCRTSVSWILEADLESMVMLHVGKIASLLDDDENLGTCALRYSLHRQLSLHHHVIFWSCKNPSLGSIPEW